MSAKPKVLCFAAHPDDIEVYMGKRTRTVQMAASEARATRFMSVSESDHERQLYLMLWPIIIRFVDRSGPLEVDADEVADAFESAEQLRQRQPRPEGCKEGRKRPPGRVQEGAQLPFGTGAETGAKRGAKTGAKSGPSIVDRSIVNKTHSYGVFKFFLPNDGYAVPRWPKRITSDHLRQPEAIAELHAIAVHHGYIRESGSSLQNLLSLAKSRIRRHVAHKTDNTGAEFTAAVKEWSKDGHEAIAGKSGLADEDWAVDALKKLRTVVHRPNANLLPCLAAPDVPTSDLSPDEFHEHKRRCVEQFENAIANGQIGRARDPPSEGVTTGSLDDHEFTHSQQEQST